MITSGELQTTLWEAANILRGSPVDLSHGFKQRVGIAQAIVHRPRLLALDEHISGLDPGIEQEPHGTSSSPSKSSWISGGSGASKSSAIHP